MITWFLSDIHFGHKNILKYDNRPWDTVEEMNEGIVNNINSVISEKDKVYYLGDFAFNYEQGLEAYKRLNGHWHFIYGNHDKIQGIQKMIQEARKNTTILGHIAEVKVQGKEITLCHYPMLSWNKSHHGTWQLFGHHHSKTYEEIKGRRLNVAISLHNYMPWSFEEIEEYMKNREIDLGRPK